MRRREFSKASLVAAASAAVAGCGGGSPATALVAPVQPGVPQAAATPVEPQTPFVAVPTSQVAIGVNLSGMEWAEPSMRYGGGTLPNVHYTAPRRVDVAYLASQGYTKTRLPFKWEMLQPMLFDTQANAAARAAIGEPGAFHGGYGLAILAILDAHAQAGIKCILDLHNYCRYRDFVFQPDGSVIGLVPPANPYVRAYTTDNTQVQMRIFALAPGATLTKAHFTNFWTQVAGYVKNHPGFGGYGIMNEPYAMPRPGETVEAFQGYGEDLSIWPSYAQAAIDAIRAIDPVNPIYLGGNDWNAAMLLATNNPAFPLRGAHLVYEVHMYLDAFSNGQSYDFDTEVARKFSAGQGNMPITLDTGVARIREAIDWANAWGVDLSLAETGMPIDDPRWEEMYRRLVDYARQSGVEVFNWLGGSHWALHNSSINHVPGWHQNKTLEPIASGPLKASAGIDQAVLFDVGPGWAAAGGTVTITVFVRGALVQPLTLNVGSNNGGSFSKTRLTIPAGSNGQDSFVFTPAANAITTLTYQVTSGSLAPPPPRKVYSLADPAAYAATSLKDAAMAILGKYSASKWELSDGYTDYMLGHPAAPGEAVRAIADSGYGSGPGNAMEMLNWINNDSAGMGTMVPPVMRATNGHANSDHSAPDTFGFWCRKALVIPQFQPNPRNRVPYNLEDPHFVLVAASVPGTGNAGLLFQASTVDQAYASELGFTNSQPAARLRDSAGHEVVLVSPAKLAPGTPAVIALTSQPGAQNLIVNGATVASASAALAASPFNQLLLGSGFANDFPQLGFGGNLYSAIAGKGAPTAQELNVLGLYLASTAGI